MKPVQTQTAEQYWLDAQVAWKYKRQVAPLWERYSWYFLLLAAQQGEI